MRIVDPSIFYSGYQINYEEQVINILTESSNGTLFSEWAATFSDFTTVDVCFSGGIDSQFVLSVLNTLGKKINVYIFSFIWEDCVFNSPDVMHAIRYCERYGYEYKNIEIDFKQFVESNKHLHYCTEYHITSPQIALHLKMLDMIESDNPIFLGTETPMMQYSFINHRAAGVFNHTVATNAFLKYAIKNNRIVIKDLFALTPKTQLLGLLQFLETTKKHKLIFPMELDSPGSGLSQPLRTLFYLDIGADIIAPLLKNTGFELLKMHMAKQTGIYNQFDISYRHPLENTLKKEFWFSKDKFKVAIKNPEVERIRKEFEGFCKSEPDIKPIEMYNFIL